MTINIRHICIYACALILLTFISRSAQADPDTQPDIPDPITRFDLPHDDRNTPVETQQSIEPQALDAGVQDWSKVTYQSYRTGNWDIFVSDVFGAQQLDLTAHGGNDIQPDLNRGNTHIVYASFRNGDYEIYKMNVDGSNAVALTNNNADDGNPTWSPDGSKILFESYRDGQAEIYVMDANGTNVKRLTQHGAFDGMPAWSPDGKTIAFSSNRSGGYRIYLMNADGTNVRQVTTQPTSLRPHFSPDGQKLAYDADIDLDGFQELWTIKIDGTEAKEIYDPIGSIDAWAGSWSPENVYVTFTVIKFIKYQGNWYWTEANVYRKPHSSHNDPVTFTTNKLNWYPHWQGSDAEKPVTAVNYLPNNSPGKFNVSWGGSDSGGSFFQHYDVQVKEGTNGTWTDWRMGTTSTSANYTGQGGKTYYFRSRGVDYAFNTEPWPTSPDTVTTVEALPPESYFISDNNFVLIGEPIILHWGATDPGGSHILHYDIRYRINGGSWVNFLTNTTKTTEVFSDFSRDDHVEFQVRATDAAKNDEAWQGIDFEATSYYWGMQGQIFDNYHNPVSNATMQSYKNLTTDISDSSGYFNFFSQERVDYNDFGWQKDGYGSTSVSSYSTVDQLDYLVVMPPADNVIQNASFENQTQFEHWTTSENNPPTYTLPVPHYVETDVVFGETEHLFNEPYEFEPENEVFALPQILTTPNGDTHMVWQSITDKLYYAFKKPNGSISSYQQLTNIYNYPSAIVFFSDSQSNIHLIVREKDGYLYHHYKRSTSQTWESPTRITFSYNSYNAVIDEKGSIHLLFLTEGETGHGDLKYSSFSPNGSWSTPIYIDSPEQSANTFTPSIILGTSGQVHAVWGARKNGIFSVEATTITNNTVGEITIVSKGEILPSSRTPVFTNNLGELFVIWRSVEASYSYVLSQRLANGEWVSPRLLSSSAPYERSTKMGQDGTLHFTWVDENVLYHQKRDITGLWSPITRVASPASSVWELILSSSGDIYVFGTIYFSDTNSSDYFFSYLDETGVWKDAIPMERKPDSISVQNGRIQYLHLERNEISDNNILYVDERPYPTAYTSTLEQTVTIPNELTAPTLSFLYQVGGVIPGDQSDFQVNIIDGGNTTTLLSAQQGSASWQHGTYNVSAWQGKTVTIQFKLNQVANETAIWAYLDEVTLGSTYPDLWVEVGYAQGALGSTTTHHVTVGNRGGALAENVQLTYSLPAGLQFMGANVAPISQSPLTWALGDLQTAGVTTLEIAVKVRQSADPFSELTSTAAVEIGGTELELLNNSATGRTLIGAFIHLPFVVAK